MLTQQQREQLKYVRDDLSIIYGRFERVADKLPEADKAGLEIFIQSIEETALDLINKIHKVDRLLSDYAKRVNE